MKLRPSQWCVLGIYVILIPLIIECYSSNSLSITLPSGSQVTWNELIDIRWEQYPIRLHIRTYAILVALVLYYIADWLHDIDKERRHDEELKDADERYQRLNERYQRVKQYYYDLLKQSKPK